MKQLAKTEIEQMITQIYNTLENNYKRRAGNRGFIIGEYLEELIDVMNNLMNKLADIDHKQASDYAKRYFLPITRLLIDGDLDVKRQKHYLDIIKNGYRIFARNSFEAFLIYYEWEKTEKFYTPRREVLKGFVYYLNKMIFDPEFEGIIANLPSGWGKTYLVDLACAFSFGVDDTGTILALCSNEDVVNGGSRTIKEIIQSPEFGEVFPNLKYDKEDREYYKKDSESEWKLKNCRLASSYFARTTRSNVVGCRASKWVWIDDLYADYKEALNEKDNQFYYNKFLTVWRKRFIQEAPIWKFIITGTMWSPTDFTVKVINWLKERYYFDTDELPFVKISDNKKFAIIQVPALNVVTGKSTCEALAPTRTLLNEKKSLDTYIFECNFQQNPISPEALAFDYKNLKTYDKTLDNPYGSTLAVIDGTRKSGKDFFSMPILQPFMNDFALIDCIYTQQPTSKLIDDIVDKIISKNIKILIIETNVDGGLKTTITKELKMRGFSNGIQIREKYSTENKQVRIELERGNILDHIFFPTQSLYALNSHMGKFMVSHTFYNIEGNNTHDDATDSLAMFTSEIIGGKSSMIKPKIIRRPF